MFCTSLRRRQSVAPVIARLIGSENMGLRESQLSTHDLALPLSASIDSRRGSSTSTRQLRVLLFSAFDTKDDKMAGTLERIRRFAALTGGQDLAIVFLLEAPSSTGGVQSDAMRSSPGQEGLVAYSKLQAALMDNSDITHIPVMPLANVDGIATLLRTHIAALGRPKQQIKSSASAFELLQLCTANPPMPQRTAFILSDLFPNLRALAAGCTSVSTAPSSSSPSVRAAGVPSQLAGVNEYGTQYSDDTATSKLKQLRELIGEQECADVVDFWKEEWTLE